MTLEEQLTTNLDTIVEHTIAVFPGFMRKLLKPHKERFVKNLSKTFEVYVNEKIKEVLKNGY